MRRAPERLPGMFAFGVWERLLDAPKPRGCKRPALSIVVPTVALALFASACDSDSTRSPSGESTAETRSMVASPLRVVAAPTPRFPVPRYDTSGTYPQVRGDLDLRAVNVGLRKAVRADQREYAPSARRSIRVKNGYRGIYQTAIDWRLLSASTVVVSALLPAIKLHPGGNEGRTWGPGDCARALWRASGDYRPFRPSVACSACTCEGVEGASSTNKAQDVAVRVPVPRGLRSESP